METNNTHITDIAMIGGSVSRIYSAWRLINNQNVLKKYIKQQNSPPQN